MKRLRFAILIVMLYAVGIGLAFLSSLVVKNPPLFLDSRDKALVIRNLE